MKIFEDIDPLVGILVVVFGLSLAGYVIEFFSNTIKESNEKELFLNGCIVVKSDSRGNNKEWKCPKSAQLEVEESQ